MCNANHPVCTENANTMLLLTTKHALALASSLMKQVEACSQCAQRSQFTVSYFFGNLTYGHKITELYIYNLSHKKMIPVNILY